MSMGKVFMISENKKRVNSLY